MKPGVQSWWRGARGEWYFVVQVLLIAIVFLGPQTSRSLPEWPARLAQIASIAGSVLVIAGLVLLFSGLFRLGRNLTPLPYPKDGVLIQSGPYRVVRHPIYAGGLLCAYGWGLVVHGWLTMLYAIALHVFISIKANREERWLVERYPEYPEYQRRTPRLIPFTKKRSP